jgi:hypothetical protein
MAISERDSALMNLMKPPFFREEEKKLMVAPERYLSACMTVVYRALLHARVIGFSGVTLDNTLAQMPTACPAITPSQSGRFVQNAVSSTQLSQFDQKRLCAIPNCLPVCSQ